MIADKYAEIKDIIRGACFRSKRNAESVHLIAVSKLQPVSSIEKAYQLGLRHFGENYVQELLEKKAALAHLDDIRWHLIGTLQTNKVKNVLAGANYIHSLDSEKVLDELVKRLPGSGATTPFPVFIQVNIDEENTKSGILPSDVTHFAAKLRKHPVLKLKGLMCIPQARENAEEMRPTFQKMKQLQSYVEFDEPLELSMGMSEDFEVAIEEGANWVRVGRRLFGDRIL